MHDRLPPVASDTPGPGHYDLRAQSSFTPQWELNQPIGGSFGGPSPPGSARSRGSGGSRSSSVGGGGSRPSSRPTSRDKSNVNPRAGRGVVVVAGGMPPLVPQPPAGEKPPSRGEGRYAQVGGVR